MLIVCKCELRSLRRVRQTAHRRCSFDVEMSRPVCGCGLCYSAPNLQKRQEQHPQSSEFKIMRLPASRPVPRYSTKSYSGIPRANSTNSSFCDPTTGAWGCCLRVPFHLLLLQKDLKHCSEGENKQAICKSQLQLQSLNLKAFRILCNKHKPRNRNETEILTSGPHTPEVPPQAPGLRVPKCLAQGR